MENKNRFWKGFFVGALCFFVLGGLAVLGMTRFLENVAARQTNPGASTQAQLPTQTEEVTVPSSTAIAPVTVPTEGPGTEPTPSPATSATPESTAAPRTIDRNADPFLDELETIIQVMDENQVLPYDLKVMEEEALRYYVEAAGGQWAAYENAVPEYGPEVTVHERTGSAFLNRMGEIRELVDQRIQPEEQQKQQWSVETLKVFVAASGDVYSELMTAQEWEETQTSSDGSYCGIGVQIMQNRETMEASVTAVFKNSPALEAGMLVGDIFKAVDGMDVTQMPLDQMVSYVRGHEGEPVKITVFRPATSETLDITCVRRQVEVETVVFEMLNGNTAYLKLTEFDNVTIRQTEEALQSLKKQGMQQLILDLRGNPGGLLNSVLSIADFFVKRGEVIFRMDYKDGETYTERATEAPIFAGKIMVLIDGGTASAAEVLTGILQDYQLATVMGTTSFGKGIVQSFFDIDNGDVLKLTIAHYYSPMGRDFHGVGIEPNIPGEDDVLTEQDELLEMALKELE